MNVNEFLSPITAVNSDGYRKDRPSHGEGQRNLISARVRLLLSNAIGIKTFRYCSYRNMPRDNVVKDGIYHICIEGMLEGQKKRERIDPEVMYIAMQMGVQLGPEYRKQYKQRFIDVVNGQLTIWTHWGNVRKWQQKARAAMFRSGLKQIEDDSERGVAYDLAFDLNAMDT